ncbi:hypothetical protein TKK_0001635 [Trichogramma kaykai]
MGIEHSPVKNRPYFLRSSDSAVTSRPASPSSVVTGPIEPTSARTVSVDSQSVDGDTVMSDQNAGAGSPATEGSVSPAYLERFRDEMMSRLETFFASQRAQTGDVVNAAAPTGASRGPPRNEVVFQSFWRSAPALWFSILEERFAQKGITDDSEMYFNAMRYLDEDLVRIVSVAVTSAPVEQRYLKLRKTLIDKLSLSESENFKNILGNIKMGARTPSEYLEFLVSSSGSFLNRDAVLRIWRETLPANVAVLLDRDIDGTNEAQNIQRADYIYKSYKRDSNAGNSFEIDSIGNAQRRDESSRMDILEKKLDQVISAFESRFDGRKRDDRRRGSGSHQGVGRGRLCRDHYKFRKAARGCSSPDRCAWKNFDDEDTEKGQGGRKHKNDSKNIKVNPDKPSSPKNSKPS